MISFLQNQYKSFFATQSGKFSIYVLFAKIRIFITLPIAIVLVIFIRLIKPFVLIRFGRIGTKRIGHFAIDPELYLCRRDAGAYEQKTYDFFYFVGAIGNQQLKKMWKRTLRGSFLANPVDKINRLLPGREKHIITLQEGYMSLKIYGDPAGFLDSIPQHLFFTASEEERGGKELKLFCPQRETPFICFQSRDSAFLDAVLNKNNWRYHDYRDSSIHNYVLAAEEMVRRGYYAIRMGHTVKEILDNKNQKIIDYATKYRNDFMDIYLISKCRFAILAHCGLKHVAIIFRTPVVCVNVIRHMGLLYLTSRDICIPKNLWLKKEKRFMKFKEIFNSGVANFGATDQYENYGVEIIENSPEEIKAVAIEMDERLNGTWEVTDEDEELQKRFRDIIFESTLPDGTLVKDILPLGLKCRIGMEFLRQNRELLE